jgi:hypothetical protein
MIFKNVVFDIVNVMVFKPTRGFSILQLLGCHGPLARRQPGRAFLEAIASGYIWIIYIILFSAFEFS